MNSDSEREKSSAPNEYTSSENRTFRDEDDDGLDDSSSREIESDEELESDIIQVKTIAKKIPPQKEYSKAENVSVSEEINVECSNSVAQNNTDKNICETTVKENIETNKLNALQIDIDVSVESFVENALDLRKLNEKLDIVRKHTKDEKLAIKIDDCSMPQRSEVSPLDISATKNLLANTKICSQPSKSDSETDLEDSSVFRETLLLKKSNINVEENITSDTVHNSKGSLVVVDQTSSAECFYSAQDLLEFGTILAGDLTTQDIESGFFEKSESDHSRDENEPSNLMQVRAIKPLTTSKGQNTMRCGSENVCAEPNKIKVMIKNIEKEGENNFEGITQHEIPSIIECGSENCVVYHGSKDLIVNKSDTSQKGYWSTLFGEASQIEVVEEISIAENFGVIQQAHRALELLEDYHSRLSDPQDRALRIAIERVIRIFKSRLFQALLARDFMEAYRCQTQCVHGVVKMLQQLKEENWCLPIMYTVCLDLRVLAQRCEEFGSSSKPGEILEKAADCLMSCFRVCAADNRSSDDDTKRLGMLNLVNQLFKVYFRINKLHLCKPLIRAIDSSVFRDSFPLPEQITYKYFVGRKAMFDSDYKSADEFLSFALANCPPNFPRNKRLILIYLVPVKMLLGYMPKKQILERFDVLQFHELAVALKEGNVRKFDEIIQRHEIFFIKCGIYLLVEKLKFIVYRNLFKKVYIIKQTHQLDLRDFRAALQFVGETNMSIDETHCIVANLIFEGKIKGYISHSHNKLVVSKQNPFPPLNTVS